MLGRLPSPTGDPRADAIAEIRWSMAGEGLTADKLRHMPVTMCLPAVRCAVADVGPEQRVTAAYAVIAEAARALGGSEPFAILRAALGVDFNGAARNLTDRRRRFGHVGDPRTIRDIERRMVEALVTALGGAPAGTPSRSPVWNVPVLRDPHFVGREDLLDAIGAALRSDAAAALTHTVAGAVSGLGGIGKTALAAEFAYRHIADYDVLWWLRAEEPHALAADYAALAVALGLPASAGSQADAIAAAHDWLAEHGRWLLVFDNARQPDDIEPYLPGLRGHVLVTSRNPYWATIATVLDVPALDMDSAVDLVVHRACVDDRDGARLLAAKLDGIPKVLEVAVGLFTRGPTASLARFATDLGEGTAATRGIWDATFDIVFATRGARTVLAACTVLDPDDIDVDLLTNALGLARGTVADAVAALHTQQILRRRVDGLAIHRLVQAAARERIAASERLRVARCIAAVLIAVDTELDPATVPFARRVQVHTPYLAAALGGDSIAGRLLRWHARRLVDDGAYRLAYDAARRALSATEGRCGPEDGDVGACLDVLARTLQNLGEHADARAVAERAVYVTTAALGPDHPDVGRCRHTLARILRNLGNAPAARDEAERALAIAERSLGGAHAEVGRCLITIAAIRRELDELEAAGSAAGRGAAILRSALGPDHGDTGWGLGVLAMVLHDLHDLDAARDAAEEALTVAQAALGSGHPDLGWYHGVLARILRDLGESTRARGEGERALAITEAALGPDHPNVAWDLHILATILRGTGDLAAARTAAERAVRIAEAVHGSTHPDVGDYLDTLSAIIHDVREPPAASDAADRSH